MLLQDLKLTFCAGYIQKFQLHFSRQRLFYFYTLFFDQQKTRTASHYIPSKCWFAFSTILFHMSSFFSITNCFTSLHNLQYSVHNLLSSLCQNLLYTSICCLTLPLISSSHHLVNYPQTTVFSPITVLATFVHVFPIH